MSVRSDRGWLFGLLAACAAVVLAASMSEARSPVVSLERTGAVWTAGMAGGLRVHLLPMGAGPDGGALDPSERVVSIAAIDASQLDELRHERGAAGMVAHAMASPQVLGSGRPFELAAAAGVDLKARLTQSGILVIAESRADQVELALDAIAGALTSPSIDERTLEAYRLEQGAALEPYVESMYAAVNTSVSWCVEPRHRYHFEPMTPEILGGLTAETVRGFFERVVLSRAVRVAVVGAILPDELYGPLSEHLGELGGRPRWPANRRVFTVDPDGDRVVRAHGSVSPNRAVKVGRAVVSVGWSGVPIQDLERFRALVVARAVLSTSLRTRADELGLGRVRTQLVPGYLGEGHGALLIVTEAEGADAARIAEVLREELDALRDGGVDLGEVDRVRRAVAQQVEQQLDDPLWFAISIAEHELFGIDLVGLLSIQQHYTAIGAAEVTEALAWLNDNAVWLELIAEAAVEPGPPVPQIP